MSVLVSQQLPRSSDGSFIGIEAHPGILQVDDDGVEFPQGIQGRASLRILAP